MKANIKKSLNIVSYFTKTSYFYLIVLLSFIACIVGGIFIGGISLKDFIDNYYEIILNVLSSSSYTIIIFLIILINTFYLYNELTKKDNIIIRFNNSKECNNIIVLTITISNIFILLLNTIFLLIATNILHGYGYNIEYLKYHNTYNIIYLLFFIIRYYSWIILLSLLNIKLFKLLSDKLTIILNIIFYIFIYFVAFYPSDFIISSINQIGLDVKVFLFLVKYSSFIFEIIISLLYVSFIILLLKVITIITNNFKLRNIKYPLIVIKNDLKSGFIKYHKIIIFYIFVLICLFTYFYLDKYESMIIDDFTHILGISYNPSKDTIIPLITYLLNISIYVYISTNILLKDMNLQISNLFLRMQPIRFFINKMFSIFIGITILKICSYLIIFGISLFQIKISLLTILGYFIKDLVYVFFIELLFLISIFIHYSYEKYTPFIILVFFIIIYLIPLSIINSNQILFGCIDIIMLFILCLLFKHNFKKIFEKLEIGG